MAAMNWHWHQLCGRNGNFTAWNHDDFSHCFELIVFVCPTHVLLALVSAYYFAQSQKRFAGSELHVSWTWFLKFRFLVTALLILCPLLQIIFSVTLLKLKTSLADCVTVGVVVFAWSLHTVYVWCIRYLHTITMRGPLAVFITFLMTMVSLGIHMRSVIIQHLEENSNHNPVEEYATYVTLGLQLMYLVTLIPNRRRIYRTDMFTRNLNYDSPETEVLSWDNIRSYGGVDQPDNLEILQAEKGVNCLSWISFHWVQPMMSRGAKHMIQSANDIFVLPTRLGTEKIQYEFSQVIFHRRQNMQLHSSENQETLTNSLQNQHLINSSIDSPGDLNSIESNGRDSYVSYRSGRHKDGSSKSKSDSLFRALNSAFGVEYYLLGILKLLADGLGFAGPILLNLLVSYIDNKKEPEYHGYIYAAGLMISTFLGTVCSTQFDYNSQAVAYKIRCAVITTVYKKALSISSVTMSKFNTGQIVNFMSTDTDRIVNFCPSFHAFWSLPFQIGVSLYLLHQQVGLAFLAGLAFAIILIPINRKLAIKIGELSNTMMEQKDARVKLMNEILYGIRVVKFYSWEEHFLKRIQTIRDGELKSLKGRKYLDAFCVYFWATTPVLISILTFSTYSLMGNKLTAAKVFTSLSLFLMLIGPLNAFPWVVNGLMEAWVSMKRVQAFFKLEELDMDKYYSHSTALHGPLMEVNNGSFSWQNVSETQSSDQSPDQSSEQSSSSITANTLKLRDINLNIDKGQFVGVIGKVGSGKSSLFSALLAEMKKDGGSVTVENLSDGFALVAQEPWIQHATVKENILFGKKYEVRRYDNVLDACALVDDLKMLPAGDHTEIGENGVTLSGGQKARIALARAVYQDKDVYFLDDPLAAVDAHVAKHLYQKCIMGLLKQKTRILSTHHTHFLSKADKVIVMDKGCISQTGPPEEVLPSISANFDSGTEAQAPDSGPEDDNPTDPQDGALVEEEEQEKGVVKLEIYKTYWLAVGKCLSPLVLLALFLMQASRNISDWWLSYWVTNSHAPNTSISGNSSSHMISTWYPQEYFYIATPFMSSSAPSVTNSTIVPSSITTYAEDNITFYLNVYGCLAGANTIFTLFRAFLFAYGGICAARVVHKNLLSSILKAPVSFFDVTPIGRIINRFSSDLYSIDDSLPFILNIFLAQSYGILGTLVITCYGLPWFAILLVPLGLLYYKIQHFYRHTSRKLKRISSVTLSPIYAHFSESLTGLSTIRALRATDRFCKENLSRLDVNQKAQYATTVAAKWLDFRLQMLGVAMVTGVAFVAVLEHHFHTVNPGLVGLAISYSLSITNLLGGVVMSFTETEKQLVSVERADQYINDVPSEQWEGVLFPPPYWPIQGAVSFNRVQMKYRPNLPNALDCVTFETEPAEKIGIVGRTGSGKSSLFLVLFRMVEIQSGEITLDGINLHHLDLKDIRSRLAIIPQDPFLFSGSVRENLDPTSTFTDNLLWTALQRCHLDSAVEMLGGLDADVAERGRHFSVGQRQLLCLARAILTNAKVLCIDEATASVDSDTDCLIQETLKTEFKDSTVLTIAHRINTILDSDRVLVMAEGKVAEFAPPGALLQNTKSLFYQLVHGRQ
ncbi:ATP-binding cassette sub-family C member 10-like [Haliotis asinina]|uniref:ATP-binding cassette sub-family C member 10-like n=1 Tax=Haliotis asinina TaxID=109174 RepID=UPI003532261C